MQRAIGWPMAPLRALTVPHPLILTDTKPLNDRGWERALAAAPSTHSSTASPCDNCPCVVPDARLRQCSRMMPDVSSPGEPGAALTVGAQYCEARYKRG